MLLFDNLYVYTYERTNTAELKKVLINLIFELDANAMTTIVKCTKKTTFKEEKMKNKERKKNLLPRGILCLILLFFRTPQYTFLLRL